MGQTLLLLYWRREKQHAAAESVRQEYMYPGHKSGLLSEKEQAAAVQGQCGHVIGIYVYK